MTIATELKKLAKTITGKDASGETIDQVLDSFNENYTGELPADFEFAVEYISGAYKVTTSATYSEITEALAARMNVRAFITDSETHETLVGTVSTYWLGGTYHFTGVWIRNGSLPNVFDLSCGAGSPTIFAFEVHQVT